VHAAERDLLWASHRAALSALLIVFAAALVAGVVLISRGTDLRRVLFRETASPQRQWSR